MEAAVQGSLRNTGPRRWHLARSASSPDCGLFAVVEDRTLAESQSPRDGRITVAAGESGEAGPSPRLIVMDADGKNARVRLGYVVHASLSPNGRSIAYDLLAARDTRVIAAEGRPRDRLRHLNGLGTYRAPAASTLHPNTTGKPPCLQGFPNTRGVAQPG